MPLQLHIDFHWRIVANGWPVCALQDEYFEESLRLQTSGGSHIWLFQTTTSHEWQDQILRSRSA